MIATLLRAGAPRVAPLLLAVAIAGCHRVPRAPRLDPMRVPHRIIPVPSTVRMVPSDTFVVDTTVAVTIDGDASAEVQQVAEYLRTLLSPSVQPAVRRLGAGEATPARSIRLGLRGAGQTLGSEGYELRVARDQVTLLADQPQGLFYAVQTLRQLLPVSVEHPAAIGRRLRIPGAHVVDVPRFAWRGTMLDVSRHFLDAADVKRYIDYLALYKLNTLHLHLSDDQGWRVEIRSWPNLAQHGGSTEVGGGPGGYYTQEQFADIVAYARSRFITVVPEFDMPGHTNAALASYPELNCDGKSPPLYTGTRVGFSTVCPDRDTVFKFVSDVVREVGALVPTPWFHIGGDEVEKLTDAQYRAFVERVQGIVTSHGKRMIGWGEIAPANLQPSTVVQHWKADSAQLHVARGGKVIYSPSKRMYVDMKYDSATVLGLQWASLIDVRHAYDWDPATLRPEIGESAILGVEAPLWSETLEKLEDFEFMAFPRLLAVAEIGWSPQAARSWDSFRLRLASHGPRLSALGINFYRSPQVPWVTSP